MDRMTACGIVAEYNPFHNGHKYHIDESRRLSGDDIVVVCMSGNYTQRGELAIIDKYNRAEMAVMGGADLVVELPVPFSISNAGYFAKAGVEILESLDVSHVSFGTEESDGKRLEEIASFIKNNEERIESLAGESVKTGVSYPKARADAIKELLGNDISDILEKPNNILALEYLKNMKNSVPVFVERKGAEYNEICDREGVMSALGIREKIQNGESISDFVPEYVEKIMENQAGCFPDRNKLFDAIVQKVISSDEDELNQIFGAEEGLGGKLKKEIRKCRTCDDLVDVLKSKRYTRTRINRVLLNVMLGLTKEDVDSAKPYIRVLGFNEKGAAYLKQIKKNSNAVFVDDINSTERNHPELAKSIRTGIDSTDIYNLICGRDLYRYSEYVVKPVIFQNNK